MDILKKINKFIPLFLVILFALPSIWYLFLPGFIRPTTGTG
jgi:hypothetical protein